MSKSFDLLRSWKCESVPGYVPGRTIHVALNFAEKEPIILDELHLYAASPEDDDNCVEGSVMYVEEVQI